MNLVEKIFSAELNSEGLKVIINIARNEPTSHLPLAKLSGNYMNNLLLAHEKLTGDDKFLLSRLLFLISIDPEAVKVIFTNYSEGVEKFVKATFDSAVDSDDSESGKIIIELLRYRYNLVHSDLYEHSAAVKESALIMKLKVSTRSVNIIGSCLNISLGKGPENICTDIEIGKFIEILEFLVPLYLKGENKDYLGSALLIALKLAQTYRGEMRRQFLPSPNKSLNK